MFNIFKKKTVTVFASGRIKFSDEDFMSHFDTMATFSKDLALDMYLVGLKNSVIAEFAAQGKEVINLDIMILNRV